MCRLNYNDLLYLIIEYDIDTINRYLHEMEQANRQKKGIDVIDATPEMATAFFKGGR